MRADVLGIDLERRIELFGRISVLAHTAKRLAKTDAQDDVVGVLANLPLKHPHESTGRAGREVGLPVAVDGVTEVHARSHDAQHQCDESEIQPEVETDATALGKRFCLGGNVSHRRYYL